MSFTRHILPILILAACGAGAAWLIYSPVEPERRARPSQPIRVDATRLAPEAYSVTLPTQGTVRPRTESTLVAEVSGTVTEVSNAFREGGFFEKGDVLLRIDPLDYEAAVTVAESSLAQAVVLLEEERARSLQALENWKELRREGTPSALVLRKPQLAEAEARVAAAEAQVRRARRDLERTVIKAPYAGRILEQNVDLGQYLGSGTVIAQIYAVDYVEIRLPLTNRQLAFIELPERYRHDVTSPEEDAGLPGVTLEGKIGGESHTWSGKIVRVEGAIDERSRQLFVVAHVDDPYERTTDGRPPLRIGLFVEAKIEGDRLEDVYVLPRSAVRADGEVILIDEDNRLRRQAITPLVSDEDAVVVDPATVPELVEGSLICLTPISFAANGVEVLPLVDGEAPPVTDAGPRGSGRGKGNHGGPRPEAKPET